MYVRNGMHCSNTGSRCSYMSSQNVSLNMLIIRGKKRIVNLREMKLGHKKYLDLNEKTCFQAFRQGSNQPTQLQRLARMLKFCVEQVYQLYLPGSEQQSR